MVDPRAARPVPLAFVPGRLYVRSDAGNGWLTGWWNGNAVVVHPSTRQGLTIAASAGRVHQLTIAGDALGAVSHEEDESILSLYRLRSGPTGEERRASAE